MVWRCPGPLPCPSPPAPPHDENRPQRGQTEQKEGRAIAFFSQGCQAFSKNPGIDPLKTPQTLMALRLEPSRVALKIPGLCHFLHGLGHFFHGSLFWFLRCFMPLLLSFSLEKEREREAKKGKSPIHGFFEVLKKASPGFTALFGKPVDEIGIPGNLFPYKSTSYVFLGQIPRSTEKNAYTPGKEVRNER